MEISDILLKEGINMGYSEADVREIWKNFALFDPEGYESIEQGEVMAILQSMGQNPTVEESDKIVSKARKDSHNRISFLEFLRHSKAYIKDYDTRKSDLKNAFLAFDSERNGYLTRNELKDILTGLGDRMSDDEVNEMMKLARIDKDGKINYEEFIDYFVPQKAK